MATILIRLDSRMLAVPDLDLRYVIPDRLVASNGELLSDEAYDYEAITQCMLIFLGTTALQPAADAVVDFLEGEPVLGNDLSLAAIVAISDVEPGDANEFRIVFPAGRKGDPYVPGGPTPLPLPRRIDP